MTTADDAHPAGGRRTAGVLALVCTAQFVDVLGVTVLIVALPTIARQMRLDGAALSWIAASYPLVFGGLLIPAGRAADIAGPWRVFILGSTLVAAGALACAVTSGAAVLLAGRAVQGLGAAMSVPAALAALLASFPAGQGRRRALGIWTMAGAAGGAFGFAAGGLVTQLAGWRWLFAAMVPLGAAAAIAALAVLAADRAAAGQRQRPDARTARRWKADVPGALLCVAAVALTILGFNQAQDHGFAAPPAWIPLALAPAAAAAFAVAERRARAPLIPAQLWSSRTFRLAAGIAGALTAATSGANVVGTLFLQRTLGLSAGFSGAAFLLFSAAVVGGSLVTPAAISRLGAIRAVSAGLAIVAAAMLIQAAAVWQRSLPAFLAGLAASGLGLGIASVGSTAYGTSSATNITAGVIGGLLNAAAQVGTAVGIAALLVAANSLPGGPLAAYLAAAAAAAAALLVTGIHQRLLTRRQGLAAGRPPPRRGQAAQPGQFGGA